MCATTEAARRAARPKRRLRFWERLRLQQRVQGRRLDLHLRGVIDRKRPDQAGRAGRPLQSLQQCRNASRQPVCAGGSQPVTAKHSCAQQRWSALDSETAWCSCLQRREQLDKRADHPGEVRSSTAHSEGLGRSPPVPSWVRAKRAHRNHAESSSRPAPARRRSCIQPVRKSG